MKVESLKLQDFAHPKRWKLLPYSPSSDKQIVLRIGHLNPENFMDKVRGIGGNVIKQETRGNVVETTITVGVKTLRGTLTDYYDAMINAVQLGFLPGMTIKDIQEMREKTNSLNPEECDFWTDISITDYKNDAIASQTLENMAIQHTKGLENVPLPGMPDSMTIGETLKSPLVKKALLKQGGSEEQLNTMLQEFQRASEQMVQTVKEANFKYEIETFESRPAVYFYPPPKHKQTKKKERKRDRLIEIKNSDETVTRIQASGGSDTRIQFPPNAFEKEELPVDGKFLQAIQVGQYIISGGLATSLNCLPRGKSFCHSLTKFKTETHTTHEDGMTYIDHLIIPVNSTYEKEGYLHREEVEEMLHNVISRL